MPNKTLYCLRTRENEKERWSPTDYYYSRKERDADEKTARCLFGIRTMSFTEKKTQEEIEELIANFEIS